MSRVLVIASAVAALAGCNKDSTSDTKLRRTGDKAAVVLVGATVEAGSLSDEKEPNNELGQAQELVLGGGVTGTLDGSSDVDHYSLSSASEGMLFIRVEGAGDADLKLELQKADGSSLARSDRGPAGVAEGVAGFWVDAELNYTIVVSEFTKKRDRKTGGRTGVSQPYRLKLSLQATAEAGFEVEANEDLEGAREVASGQEGFGYVGWAGDTDWWRIPVSEFAEVEATLPGEEPPPRRALDIVVSGVAKVAMQFELATASGETVAQLRSAPGREVALRSFVPKVASEFYLLKVSAKRSNPEENYQVGVALLTLPHGGEAEPNDSIETATMLSSEIGVLTLASGEACMGDVDMFTLASSEVHRNVDLRLELPSGSDLGLSVVAENGAVIAQSEQVGAGLGENLTAVDIPPNTSPVFVVRANKVDLPGGYKLSVSVSEGQGVQQIPVPVSSESETPTSVE